MYIEFLLISARFYFEYVPSTAITKIHFVYILCRKMTLIWNHRFNYRRITNLEIIITLKNIMSSLITQIAVQLNQLVSM
jgi:hypothetical protein